MNTHKLLIECPACGYDADSASGIDHANAPEPGAVTVCIGCGAILELDTDMKPVLVPDAKAKTDPELDVAREAQRKVRKMLGLPL